MRSSSAFDQLAVGVGGELAVRRLERGVVLHHEDRAGPKPVLAVAAAAAGFM